MSKSTPASSLLLLAAIGTAGAVLPGCQSSPAQPPEPPKVTVARPVQKDVVDYAEFTGTTKAVQTLDVRARVQGNLISVKQYTGGKEDDFTEGAIVKAGTLLFVIEPDIYKAKLAEAEARLKQGEARLALAQANYNRSVQLFQQNTISREEFDTKTAERDAAEADVLQAQADVHQARIDLGYTEIYAPFDGRVGRRLVDLGNLVGAGESTLLTTIEKTNPMYAYFDVNERVVLKVQRWRRDHPGRQDDDPPIDVYLGLADEKECPHKGFLDFVDNAVDPTTGTALVRGVFPNEDGLLYPGLFVRLRIPGEVQKDALLVEEAAMGTDLEGKYLLVVGENNTVEKRRVEPGTLQDGMRVILEGLKPDEHYIVKGLQLARPGLPVQPEEPTRPTDP